jgi:hypothetical protein
MHSSYERSARPLFHLKRIEAIPRPAARSRFLRPMLCIRHISDIIPTSAADIIPGVMIFGASVGTSAGMEAGLVECKFFFFNHRE